MGTVVVLGSIITDLVARAPRLPLPGEALIGDDFSTFPGGKGINQAIAAARLGANVTMIGRVGTDTFGDIFFPILKREAINSAHVARDTHTGTGVAIIIIGADTGQNMLVPMPRANMEVTAEAVEEALQAVQTELQHAGQSASDAIFLTQCETSTISFTTGIKRARALGMMTILNAAPVPRELFADDLYTFVDILVVNEVEAATFAGTPVNSVETAQTAAEILLGRGVQHVIITLGAQGCLWSTRDKASGAATHQALPPFKVQPVDTTAAGDAFCGALAAGLSNGITLPTALQQASATGALAATKMGAIPSLPTAAEVQSLLTRGQ